ncbi:formate dehydrogenase accessory protein FdhE [Bartonella sp. CB169]|uniref:formate dehydrogenase accessory protein FdhE n=1 Tax=Bartonella sp. CB169 TaxID=3112257 RepID=UPI00300E4707
MHAPSLVILPDKKNLFAKRAQRFAYLAKSAPNPNSILDKESLLFFAHFCNAQQQLTEKFKNFATPLSRFCIVSAPPFDRSKLLSLGLYESIAEDFLKHLSTQTFSTIRYEALSCTRQKKDQWRLWGHNLLNHILPPQQLTEHIFIIGALQIIYSLAASQLDAQNFFPQQKNLCPACSGTHFANLIIDWKSHKSIKVCSCLYCGTLWHIPNTQCTFCKSTQNISSHTIENMPDSILFETCAICGSYCKQLNQHKNPTLDVFADEISTPTPDPLHNNPSYFKRKSFNPFLAEHRKQPAFLSTK